MRQRCHKRRDFVHFWNVCLAKAGGKLAKPLWLCFWQSILAGVAVVFFGFCSAWVGAKTGSGVLTGLTFSLALLTILTFRLELFTGNCLLAAPAVDGRCGYGQPALRLWLSFFGNMAGGVAAALALLSLALPHLDPRLTDTLLHSVAIKAGLPWPDALFRGIGCNVLVCGGVLTFWFMRGFAKIAATSLLIVLFVLASYEHIVANFLYWTVAVWFRQPIAWGNVCAVTLGNVAGGLLVVYGLHFGKSQPAPSA